MHPSSLARTTSMPTLEVVPPIVPSRISTKEKSKIASQFSLGHVAPFVVDLRGKAVAMHVLVVMGPSGPTLSLHIEGIPMNNINNAKRRPHPIYALGQTRHLQEDRSKRPAKRKARILKKAFGPIMEAKKTSRLRRLRALKAVAMTVMMDYQEGTMALRCQMI
jgi:hypothetical protein